MPETTGVESVVRDGESGFVVTQEYSGINNKAVKGRAVGRLASKYPLRANDIEVIDFAVLDSGGAVHDFELEIFIPFSGIEDNKGVSAIKNLVSEL